MAAQYTTGWTYDNNSEKNCYFKDMKAYTEDDILVYNIFVYKIAPALSEQVVLEYFARYGAVERIHLVAPQKKPRWRGDRKVCFINYADPAAAFKVLASAGSHRIEGKRVCVKACDSWNQPLTALEEDVAVTTGGGGGGGGGGVGVDDDVSSDQDTKCQTNINHLNYDCLDNLCKYLDLVSQVRLARVCAKFREAFIMRAKAHCKSFVLDDLGGLTMWEERQFFEMAGKHMQTLTGTIRENHPVRTFEFITTFCRNVETLKWNRCNFKTSNWAALCSKLSSIKELEVTGSPISDGVIKSLKKLRKLTNLSLVMCYELTGKHLSKLSGVTELCLRDGGNIQPSNLIEVFTSLQNLKKLDIKGCARITPLVFVQMAEHCLNLEVLVMGCPKMSYASVGKLPKLRHLELIVASPIENSAHNLELLCTLKENAAARLEYLKLPPINGIAVEATALIGALAQLKYLHCNRNTALNDYALREFENLTNLEEVSLQHCTGFGNEGLQRLLTKCTKLQRVYIQGCSQISSHFVVAALNELVSSRSIPEKPIEFCAGRTTGIKEDILTNPLYIRNQPYLKVLFDQNLCLDKISHYSDGLLVDDYEYSDEDYDYDYDYDDSDGVVDVDYVDIFENSDEFENELVDGFLHLHEWLIEDIYDY